MTRFGWVSYASGAVLAFALSGAAFAETAAAPAPQQTRSADQTADQGAVVGDVIVTALRREERLRDVPVSITAVTVGAGGN